MPWFKILSLTFGVAGLGTGLYAAYLWKAASRVAIIPTFIQYGGIEPVDPSIARDHWIVGIIEYAKESGSLNSSAAMWTGVAVLCSSLSSVVGLFS